MERAALCKNKAGAKILKCMQDKKSNLCVSVDVTKKAEVLALVSAVGPYVCMVKTHCDIIEDFDLDMAQQLVKLSEKHNFVIFEDRKFADIGNTVMHQFEGGVHKIASWTHVTNCHIVPGPGIVEGLKEVGLKKGLGLMLLAEMSSKGNHATGAYTDANVMLAKQHLDFVCGFITMRRLCDEPGLINMTPGVQLKTGTDGLGQQFKTPHSVIVEQKSDMIIVGRGIYKAKDPAVAAKEYQTVGWAAYEERLRGAASKL
jgi:orotidine 5'-phosphate decarboxylase subfamily 1